MNAVDGSGIVQQSLSWLHLVRALDFRNAYNGNA
jgi:hypothetical protein